MAIFNIISFSYSSSYWKLIYYLVWTLSLDANTFEETRISPRARFYSMWWWFDAKFGVIKVLVSILFITRNVGKYLYIAYNFSLHRLVLSIFTLMFILVIRCISWKTQQNITYYESIFGIWSYDYMFRRHWICNVYLNNKIS